MLVESEMEILPVTSNNLDYGKKIIVTYNDYFEFLYLNPSYPVADEVTFDKLIDRFITLLTPVKTKNGVFLLIWLCSLGGT